MSFQLLHESPGTIAANVEFIGVKKAHLALYKVVLLGMMGGWLRDGWRPRSVGVHRWLSVARSSATPSGVRGWLRL